jgi:hypothetical protein
MSLHINRFVDSIKAHEARGQRDFTMSLRDAKDLHADITKLLLTLQGFREQQQQQDQVIEVQITGGDFKNS